MTVPKEQDIDARRLRRAVAELAEYSIDDIESIWRALSDTERAQLHPLLADMPDLMGNRIGTHDSANARRPSPDASNEDDADTAAQLARIAPSLPHELVSRLLICVDHRTQNTVINALPPEKRALLINANRTCTITEVARNALQEAALTAAGSMSDLPRPTISKSPTFVRKIRHWLERQT